jgi:hypothetical protein
MKGREESLWDHLESSESDEAFLMKLEETWIDNHN